MSIYAGLSDGAIAGVATPCHNVGCAVILLSFDWLADRDQPLKVLKKKKQGGLRIK
jgi:hypothetical protein